MHSYLNGLEGTERDVGDEFGRSTGSEIEGSLITICIVLSRQIGVELLEELITSILESTLGLAGDISHVRLERGNGTYRISKEGRAPAGEDTTEAFSPTDLAPRLEVPLVHLGIHLPPAFDQVQRCHSRMRDTTGEEPSKGTSSIVFRGVELDWAGFGLRLLTGFLDFSLCFRAQALGFVFHVVDGAPGGVEIRQS